MTKAERQRVAELEDLCRLQHECLQRHWAFLEKVERELTRLEQILQQHVAQQKLKPRLVKRS